MSPIALTNAATWIAAHDFTGDSNHVRLATAADTQDATTFASGGWKENMATLKSVTGSSSGFWSSGLADSVDSDVFANLGVGGELVTVTPTGTALDAAYFYLATKLQYSIFDEIGKLAPFSLDMSGSSTAGLVRGQLAKAKGAVSATGAIGSGANLGAVASGKSLYSGLHLLGTAGTTITVVVESDTTSGFAAPTTRATIGPLTTVGGTFTKTAGPFTDTWWRYRVSAITGTWTVAGSLGIA